MIRKKLCSRRGLTLAETLAALLVFAILSVALVQGTTAAWKVYKKAVIASEARTLQSTLTQALSNELRYAENIRLESEKVVFDSATYGQYVSIENSDGRIQIGIATYMYDLVPKKAYTGGLKAEAEKIVYENGIFTVDLTITHPLLTDGMKSQLKIQAVNADA